MATGWQALGHLGHLFCIAKVTQSMAMRAHAGANALGHLGHLVIDLKLAPGDALSTMHGFIGIYPYIKITYFLIFKT
jgi:hypothetical protein